MENMDYVTEFYNKANANGIMDAIISTFGLGARVQLQFLESILCLQIEELDLSVRSYNCLKRTGINIIEELLDAINNNEWPSIRNLGAKSIGEIRAKVVEFGYNKLTEQNKKQFIKNLININE